MPKAEIVVPVRKLPTLNDLYSVETLDAIETSAELTLLLNSEPNPKWVKQHPYSKIKKVIDGQKKDVPLPYLPIERVKWLLSRIFVEWEWENRIVIQAWNGVIVSGRLRYRHPSGEWRSFDGIGGAKIQFKKDTLPMAENIVQDSIERAPGIAESAAIKNAAKKLGRLFGADLVKNEDIDYDAVMGRFDTLPIGEEELSDLQSEIDSSKIDREGLMEFLKASYGVVDLAELPRNLIQTVRMRITSANNHDGNS